MTIACGHNTCLYYCSLYMICDCSCGSSCKKEQTSVYEGLCSEPSHQCRDCTFHNLEHRVHTWFMWTVFRIFLFNTVVVYGLTSVELYWHATQKISERPQRSTEQCLDRWVAGEGVIQLEYTEVR
jgi:hypothetical protein